MKSKSRKKLHIQEIPKKYLPKRTKAKEFRNELVRLMSDLRFTNERVQYSAQISSFNIKAIPHKAGFVPKPSEVFRQINGFVYHYENFCYRAYAFREKLLKFLNAIFIIELPDQDVKMNLMKKMPAVKEAGLVTLLEKFQGKQILKKVIEDRNSLTHKLYYGSTFDHYLRPIHDKRNSGEGEFKRWLTSWRTEIINRSKLTDRFTHEIYGMNHELSERIIRYKGLKKQIRQTFSKKLS